MEHEKPPTVLCWVALVW